MKKTLLIIGSLVVLGGAIGTHALMAQEDRLEKKLTSDLEMQLIEATNTDASVGKTDIQLLQRKVVLNDLALGNIPGFTSSNLLKIRQVTLSEPSLSHQPYQVAAAEIEGVNINLEGDLDDLSLPALGEDPSEVNLAQLGENLDEIVAKLNEGRGNSDVLFSADAVSLNDLQLNINLILPWQEEALVRTITFEDVVLQDVNDQNLVPKLADSLGPKLTEELAIVFFEDILPGTLQEAPGLIPDDWTLDLPGV